MERPAADRCRVASGILDDAAPSSRALRRLGDRASRPVRELARARSSQHSRWDELGYFDGPAWSGGHGLLRSPVRHTLWNCGDVSPGPIHGRIVHGGGGVLPGRETAPRSTMNCSSRVAHRPACSPAMTTGLFSSTWNSRCTVGGGLQEELAVRPRRPWCSRKALVLTGAVGDEFKACRKRDAGALEDIDDP